MTKKILFLSRWFFPHIGGVETHLLKISQILSSLGYQITIITGNPDSKFLSQDQIDHISVFRIPLPSRPSPSEKFIVWSWLFSHRNLILQSSIVHCHDVSFWYLPFRFLFPFKPVFTTFHGFEGHYPISSKAFLTRKVAEKLTLGNICVGNFITKWYQTQPTFITYGGVDLPSVSQISAQKRLFIFLGRLEKDTGLPIFVKALRLFNHQHPRYKLQIQFVGDGSLRSLAQTVGPVLGFQNHQQINHLLSKSRFVFASGYLSILQAMARQCLVFTAYNNPIKKDYLEMTPFSQFINIASSPQQLSDQFHHFLHHPAGEQQLIKKAYSWVKHQSWNQVTDQYLKLWQI